MKVLFLTKYPVSGASSRYRVYQYLTELEQQGIACEVEPFYDERGFRTVFGNGHAVGRMWAATKAVCRRLSKMLGRSEFDLLYLQRELLPVGPPWLERWLHHKGVPMVFDYDDALFVHKDSAVSGLMSRIRNPGRILDIFRLVDVVVAGNEFLADQARPYCDRVYVVEVAEDLERIVARSRHRESDAVTLGWMGSRSTEKYLHLITPALQQFFSVHPQARLVVVGGGRFQAEGIPIRHEPWSLKDEVALLHQFDIGLMPLPEEVWSLGKCGGKARTYMAAGVPAVCTDMGYNRELIRSGETGFLVTGQNDWFHALDMLARDPMQRQRVAEKARRDVEQRFSQDRIAGRLAEVIREVAGNR